MQAAQIIIIPCIIHNQWTQIKISSLDTNRKGGFGSTDIIAGTKVWIKQQETDVSIATEIITQGKDDNMVMVIIPGDKQPKITHTNNLFLWN